MKYTRCERKSVHFSLNTVEICKMCHYIFYSHIFSKVGNARGSTRGRADATERGDAARGGAEERGVEKGVAQTHRRTGEWQ